MIGRTGRPDHHFFLTSSLAAPPLVLPAAVRTFRASPTTAPELVGRCGGFAAAVDIAFATLENFLTGDILPTIPNGQQVFGKRPPGRVTTGFHDKVCNDT